MNITMRGVRTLGHAISTMALDEQAVMKYVIVETTHVVMSRAADVEVAGLKGCSCWCCSWRSTTQKPGR